MLTNEDLKDLGFKDLPHMTVTNSMQYELGRDRLLSIGSIGTPNEILVIMEYKHSITLGSNKQVTDCVILHNYDYDGYLTIEKLNLLLKFLS